MNIYAVVYMLQHTPVTYYVREHICGKYNIYVVSNMLLTHCIYVVLFRMYVI